MDMSFSPQYQAFRAEVRQFLQDRLPQRLSEKVRLFQELTKAEIEEWHAILNEKGWLAGNWRAWRLRPRAGRAAGRRSRPPAPRTGRQAPRGRPRGGSGR